MSESYSAHSVLHEKVLALRKLCVCLVHRPKVKSRTSYRPIKTQGLCDPWSRRCELVHTFPTGSSMRLQCGTTSHFTESYEDSHFPDKKSGRGARERRGALAGFYGHVHRNTRSCFNFKPDLNNTDICSASTEIHCTVSQAIISDMTRVSVFLHPTSEHSHLKDVCSTLVCYPYEGAVLLSGSEFRTPSQLDLQRMSVHLFHMPCVDPFNQVVLPAFNQCINPRCAIKSVWCSYL